MATFTYTARNSQGQVIKGTVSAADKPAAAHALATQGLKPLLLKDDAPASALGKIGALKLGQKVKSRDMVIFTRQLATMIDAGVPLARALFTLQAQTDNKFFKEQLGEITKSVESGVSLGDALGQHPKIFSSIYINMVRAGEEGGILDDVLLRLALQTEKDAAIKAKVKSASTYPMVLLAITVIAFLILTVFVVPKIGALVTNLGGPDSKLPPQTQLMLSVSKLIRHQWYLVALIVVGGPLSLNHWRKTPRGKRWFDSFLLKVPIIKTVVIKVAVARFSRIFASLMGAGVSVLQSLEVTSQAIGNHVVEQELLNAANEVKNGQQLSQSLSQSKFFPPIVSQMLAVGEETGKTDTILIKVADFYEEEVDAVVDSLSSILEPVMIVVMGSMVGFIAASVIGPISGLANNIK